MVRQMLRENGVGLGVASFMANFDRSSRCILTRRIDAMSHESFANTNKENEKCSVGMFEMNIFLFFFFIYKMKF